MTLRMEFRLFGPLTVRCNGVAVPVARGKQRALLAALLLNAGHVVSVPYLIEVLWGINPPPSAQASLQNYVKRLRHALGQAGRSRICTHPGGYLFRVEDGELDVARAEEFLQSARDAARNGLWEQASALAAAAVSLWHGEPLVDVNSQVLALQEVPRLREIYLQLLEARLEADLQLGHHHDVIAELTHLTAAHPLRERLYAMLMLALYRCDRRADALAMYQHARHVLVEELGSEPGPGLREAHRQILVDDPTVAAPDSARLGHLGGLLARPGQLPAPVPGFVGRNAELTALYELLNCDVAGAKEPVTTAVISGTAGVGKTALAVHWANRVLDHFPDGQLYMNLRGYDTKVPVRAADALARFLHALGMSDAEIPADTDERAAAYRSLLAGRRMLVVLDNAHEAGQVRPLLPGSLGCLVVVTSRNLLSGLVATEGARTLTLDVLSQKEARCLLAARVGVKRLTEEPDAAPELITLCARLPLALCIVAAQAIARPRHPLSTLTAELGHSRQRLDVLDAGDTATNVREVFSWSYQHLSPSAARMFRLIGVHPGPEITASAAAALAGTSAHEALGSLTELARTHMLMEHLPGRYAFHDLLRAYAAERTHTEDSTTERSMAIGRVLNYYVHTAHAADHLLYTDRETLALDPPLADAMPDHLADERCAQTWLTTEHTVLLRIILKAEEMRFDTHAWQLPVCLSRFLDLRGHWDDWAAIGQVALRAARRLGDTAAQARIHLILAYACTRLDSRDAVRINLGDALKLYRKLGDRAGQARVHLAYCKVLQREANYRDGFGHAQQALILYWSAGERAGQAIALDILGWAHAHLKRPQLALACCQLALSLHRQASNRMGEAGTWDSLGYAHHQAGQYHQAVACYRRAITGFHEFAAEFEEACSLVRLGDTYFKLGCIRQARDAWEEALTTFEEVKHKYSSRVRSRLHQLDSSTHFGIKSTRKLTSSLSFEPIDTV